MSKDSLYIMLCQIQNLDHGKSCKESFPIPLMRKNVTITRMITGTIIIIIIGTIIY